MNAEPTTKPPKTVPDKSVEKKPKLSQPLMPQIPGVKQAAAEPRQASNVTDSKLLAQIGGVAVAVLITCVLLYVSSRNKPRANADLPSLGSEAAAQPAQEAAAAPGASPAQAGTNVAAQADQLPKPWDSKKFVFVKPYSEEHVNAIVVRLPDGGLWAFSLREAYGKCDLEYVTDLDKIASQYGYRAAHPMVVNLCSKAVYDPLKVGPLGGDVWARGEIVKGTALRPPFSIEVKVSEGSIVADQME